MHWKPHQIHILSGFGKAEKELELLAFDRALLNAGCANLNLVKVTSVLPPGVGIFSSAPMLPAGTVVPTVYSCYKSSKEGAIISCCISCAKPKDSTLNGMFFEVSGEMPREESRRIAIREAELSMQDRGYEVREIIDISSETIVNKGESAAVVAVAIFVM